jgi:hypothetical protein
VTNALGMIIETTVAVLLVLTISYCMMLNRRLKLLKADEHSLRATISELVTATEIAERAIGGLKLTVSECERGLGARLASAERYSADLDRGIAAGKEVLDRIAQIATAGGRPGVPGVPGVPVPARHDPQAVAVAAKAFAEKLRSKVNGYAA